MNFYLYLSNLNINSDILLAFRAKYAAPGFNILNFNTVKNNYRPKI